MPISPRFAALMAVPVVAGGLSIGLIARSPAVTGPAYITEYNGNRAEVRLSDARPYWRRLNFTNHPLDGTILTEYDSKKRPLREVHDDGSGRIDMSGSDRLITYDYTTNGTNVTQLGSNEIIRYTITKEDKKIDETTIPLSSALGRRLIEQYEKSFREADVFYQAIIEEAGNSIKFGYKSNHEELQQIAKEAIAAHKNKQKV